MARLAGLIQGSECTYQVADLAAPLPTARHDVLVVYPLRRRLRVSLGGLCPTYVSRPMAWHSVLLPRFGSGGRLGRGLRCLVLRACRSERKALLRAATDETRAASTNASSLLDPLPARRWRRSRADVLPVDADGCTVSRAPIPIISPTLEAYLRLAYYVVIYTHRQFT